MDERSSNAQPLHHAFGVGAHLTVGSISKLKHFQQFPASFSDQAPVHTMDCPMKIEKFPAGQESIVTRILGQVTNLASGLRSPYILIENGRRTTGRTNEVTEKFDGSALAGTIGTQETENLTILLVPRDATPWASLLVVLTLPSLSK
jgi:hypothetical protein